MTSITRGHPRLYDRGIIAAPTLLGALVIVACGNDGPAAPSSEPSAERTQTTVVDSAVIRNGVFTARLGVPWVNQFGFTVIPVGVHIRNAGPETLVGEFTMTPGCEYWVRLYRTSDRSAVVRPPSDGTEVVCAGTNTSFEIEPGAEDSVPNGTRFGNWLLGDSLPEAWYHPTLTIAPFGVLTELKVDSVRLVRP